MLSRWTTRISDVDPWGPVSALVALAVFVLHGHEDALGRDLGLYAYSGQRVAAGEAPYEAVLNRTGPLGHLVDGAGALVARLLHTDDIVTMRWVMTVLVVATVWILYVVGRDLLASKIAGVVTSVTFLRFGELLEFATGGPREKTTMLLLVALTLLMVLRRRWAVAGAMTAFATLTWQPAFFLAAPAALGALLVLPRRDMFRAISRFVTSGIAATAVVSAILWMWGAGAAFLQCFLLINLRYTTQSTGLEIIRDDPARFYQGTTLDLVLLVVGLASVIVFAVLRVLRSDRRDDAARVQIGLGLAALASIAWSLLFALQSWADLMVLTPVAALGVAMVVQHALAAAAPVAASRRARAATGAVAVLCLVGVGLAGWRSYSTRTHDLVRQRAEVSAVLAAAPPGASVVSIEAAQALALGHKVNPNRYQMFTNGLEDYLQDNYPGGLAGIRRLIESEHPTLVACSCGRETETPGKHAFIRPLLEAEYTKIGDGWHFSWYARNTLGQEVIHRLREAARVE